MGTRKTQLPVASPRAVQLRRPSEQPSGVVLELLGAAYDAKRLLRAIKRFQRDSLAGKYYAPFMRRHQGAKGAPCGRDWGAASADPAGQVYEASARAQVIGVVSAPWVKFVPAVRVDWPATERSSIGNDDWGLLCRDTGRGHLRDDPAAARLPELRAVDTG